MLFFLRRIVRICVMEMRHVDEEHQLFLVGVSELCFELCLIL